MNIYISHSRDFDFKKELYDPLKSLVSEHEFIFPHSESDTPFETKKLFESKVCKLVIAEVTYPSIGQGVELGWANLLKIPIIFIYKKGSKISNSLKLISSEFIEYENLKKISETLNNKINGTKN
ncbi:MAG: hypothetical protein AAB410_01645 [Patescibacteria group bacterium]